MNTLQIKVQLKDFKPSIYRTFLLSENDTFLDLNNYIQDTFWFFGYHLWHFYKRDWRRKLLEIIQKDEYLEEYFEITKEPSKIKLKEVFIKLWMEKITYEYDFWDSWEFDVTCQKIIENDWKKDVPKLIKSKWGHLIEDCWWIWWLEELVENYKKKKFDKDIFESWEDFEEYMEPYSDEIDVKNYEI